MQPHFLAGSFLAGPDELVHVDELGVHGDRLLVQLMRLKTKTNMRIRAYIFRVYAN